MSLNNVESVDQSGSSNPLVIAVTASTIGNLLVVMIDDELQNNTISNVTDNGSNTWIQVPSARGSSAAATVFTDIWYCISTASITSVSVHYTNSHNGFVQYMEWSGIKSTSPVDASNNAAATLGPVLTPSLTISNSGDLLLSVVAVANSNPTGISSPWAVVANGFNYNFVQNVAPGSTGAMQGTYTAGSQAWCSSGVAFFPAPAQNPALVASTLLVF